MIHVDWGNLEETLLVWKVERDWSWDEFHEVFARTQLMLRLKTETVHVLFDMQRLEPTDETLICAIYDCVAHAPKNVGRTVVISCNPLWRTWWRALLSDIELLNAPIYFVDSANDAYELVEDVLV